MYIYIYVYIDREIDIFVFQIFETVGKVAES